MIEASCTSRSTSRAVIAATLATSKSRNAFRNASRFPNTIAQLSPTSNTPRVSASKIADSSWVRVPQTSSWYRPKAVSPAPAQAQRGLPSCPMMTSLLIRPARIEGEGTAKGIDGGFAVGRDQSDAHVFECGGQLEPSLSALEEIDGLAEIRVAWPEKTTDMGQGCRDRGDAGVQLRSTPAVEERKLRDFVVVCGKSDSRELHVVGDVEREPRQNRSAVRFGRSAEPAPCGVGVAFGQSEEREQP